MREKVANWVERGRSTLLFEAWEIGAGSWELWDFERWELELEGGVGGYNK